MADIVTFLSLQKNQKNSYIVECCENSSIAICGVFSSEKEAKEKLHYLSKHFSSETTSFILRRMNTFFEPSFVQTSKQKEKELKEEYTKEFQKLIKSNNDLRNENIIACGAGKKIIELNEEERSLFLKIMSSFTTRDMMNDKVDMTPFLTELYSYENTDPERLSYLKQVLEDQMLNGESLFMNVIGSFFGKKEEPKDEDVDMFLSLTDGNTNVAQPEISQKEEEETSVVQKIDEEDEDSEDESSDIIETEIYDGRICSEDLQ